MSQFFNSDTLPTRTTAPTPDPPPFGSRMDDFFDTLGGSGSTSQFTETILAGAGLTVHGAGYLSYPGEGLVKDGFLELRCQCRPQHLITIVVNGRPSVCVW